MCDEVRDGFRLDLGELGVELGEDFVRDLCARETPGQRDQPKVLFKRLTLSTV